MRRIIPFAIVLASMIAFSALAADHPAANPKSQTGHLHLTFTERSPNSALEVIRRRKAFTSYFPSKGLPPNEFEYDIAKESFEVVVPPRYSASVPHGLFVFISAGEAKVMPTWLPVFTRHKLIFVSANNTGNDRRTIIRIGLALDAVHNLAKQYNIDPDRIYISGFSGGGLNAALLVHAYPEVFHGFFGINGEDFYDGHWNESGALEPGVMEMPEWSGKYDEIKKYVRLVLLSGQKDIVFEPDITIANAQGLTLDGFRTTLLIVPGGGHRHPDANWFERGIKALDAKPTPGPTTSPTRQPNPGPGQIAQARRYLATAQSLTDGENAEHFHGTITRHLERILKDYPTTPSAPIARDLLAWLKKNIQPAKRRGPESQPAPAGL